MEFRAASLEAAAAAAAPADGAYVTPELLMRAVHDISTRRRTSSAADITMYLQRRFPMRHVDRRLLKEVQRKLHIATQHGLFVHTGYSYRLPAERLGKALSSKDLSAFWSHYHRLERDWSSDSSTESGSDERAEEPGRAGREVRPQGAGADKRRRPRRAGTRGRRVGRAARCSCRCHCESCSRSASEDSARTRRRHTRAPLAAASARRRQRCGRRLAQPTALVRCASTIVPQQPPEQQPPEAGGPSGSLLMYLVLKLAPESDDGTASS